MGTAEPAAQSNQGKTGVLSHGDHYQNHTRRVMENERKTNIIQYRDGESHLG